MLRACGLRASARLALLQHNDPSRMLMFEAPRAAARAAASPSPSSSSEFALASEADAHGEVIVTSLGLNNTLLASALAEKEAHFVSDCGVYMQVGSGPAVGRRDWGGWELLFGFRWQRRGRARLALGAATPASRPPPLLPFRLTPRLSPIPALPAPRARRFHAGVGARLSGHRRPPARGCGRGPRAGRRLHRHRHAHRVRGRGGRGTSGGRRQGNLENRWGVQLFSKLSPRQYEHVPES
jgi:hypothetical protein